VTDTKSNLTIRRRDNLMARPKKTTLCPLGGTGVGGIWMFWIWYHLLSGTKRFGELQRLLPQASRQMLTIQLRDLEQLGVIHRQVYAEKAPRVEYSLTDLARSSEPLVRQLYAWSRWCSEQTGWGFDEWLVSLSGRWTMEIWYALLGGAKRLSALHQMVPAASRQVLIRQLRALTRMGVVQRQQQQGDPITYALTDLGQQSGPMLRLLYTWGKWYCDQLDLNYAWPAHVAEDLCLQAHPLPLDGGRFPSA
jgi:DNA-binding HxlR family transcriptional regulator